MCIKKDISLLGEERGKKQQRHLTNFLLYYRHLSLWMHVFCSCAVKIFIVPKATTCVFLGYAQSGYRCYDVKSKRLDVSFLFNDHIFLNLINQPRGRMMMEMYCGLLLLFINRRGLILLQIRSSLSQLWFRIKKSSPAHRLLRIS